MKAETKIEMKDLLDYIKKADLECLDFYEQFLRVHQKWQDDIELNVNARIKEKLGGTLWIKIIKTGEDNERGIVDISIPAVGINFRVHSNRIKSTKDGLLYPVKLHSIKYLGHTLDIHIEVTYINQKKSRTTRFVVPIFNARDFDWPIIGIETEEEE